MKRYELAEVCPGVVVYKKEMRESENGEWVRYEDAVAEREELVKALEGAVTIMCGHCCASNQYLDACAALKKARGE